MDHKIDGTRVFQMIIDFLQNVFQYPSTENNLGYAKRGTEYKYNQMIQWMVVPLQASIRNEWQYFDMIAEIMDHGDVSGYDIN